MDGKQDNYDNMDMEMSDNSDSEMAACRAEHKAIKHRFMADKKKNVGGGSEYGGGGGDEYGGGGSEYGGGGGDEYGGGEYGSVASGGKVKYSAPDVTTNRWPNQHMLTGSGSGNSNQYDKRFVLINYEYIPRYEN